MKLKLLPLFLITALLFSLPLYAANKAYKQAGFPKYLPALGDSVFPSSTNKPEGSTLIHQNYVIKGQNMDLYAKQYMKELRLREWKIKYYQRKNLGNNQAALVINSEHPLGYDLRLSFTTVATKNRDVKLKLILKKNVKIKRVNSAR